MVSDDKLVDLLDLALSADTSNTIKSVRDAVESGVDPLELMSQLAATVTDILAGGSVFNPERPQRKFFCCPTCKSKIQILFCSRLVLKHKIQLVVKCAYLLCQI